MFFSLNKKFFFTILAFLLLSAAIFIIIFDGIVGKKIRNEHTNIISRNQYVIELLNENLTLRKKIQSLTPEKNFKADESLSQKQKELSYETKLNEELNQNYNETYAALYEGLKLISIGATLTLLSLLIFWFLLRRWILLPIDKLTKLSIDVANGNFANRLKHKKNIFTDEFDTLTHTVNFMLDNIENNINEIKEKEIFLQSLIDALPDAIRVIDKDYNILLYNKAYKEHIKNKYFYPAHKCYASYLQNADCPCSSSQYICPIKELHKETKTKNNLKLIHSVNDRPLSINSAPISINKTTGIVESIRDLSENVNYSHQQKISSLGFLATSLAHEMKNNLGAINLILEGILQKHYPEDNLSEEKKYLEMISSQIKECIKVPERLLKLSRTSEQSTLFNVTSNINDTLSLLDYEIKHKGIALTKSFSNTSEKIIGNETDFKMIILNLVQNAINAMPNGGELEIKTNTNKENLLIEIKDTGCGIEETSLKHIFEPFYSSSASEKERGTGLGLAIVKDLVLKFKGKITVTSKKDIGTSFQIAFPRHKTQKILVK